MQYKNTLIKYKNISKTVDKMQQIILLYEGIVNLIRKAKNSAINNYTEEKFNILDKVSQIINGLSSSIDYQQGGEIASILEQYYNFLYIKIFSLNHSNDLSIYDDIENHLLIMLDAWKDVANQQTLDNNKQGDFLV